MESMESQGSITVSFFQDQQSSSNTGSFVFELLFNGYLFVNVLSDIGYEMEDLLWKVAL